MYRYGVSRVQLSLPRKVQVIHYCVSENNVGLLCSLDTITKKPKYRVVIGEQANELARYAALEINREIYLASKVKPSVHKLQLSNDPSLELPVSVSCV